MGRVPIFISWTKDNGRTRELSAALGVEPVFIFDRGNVLIRYIRSAIRSYRLTRKAAREEVTTIIMLPPAPLAVAAALGSRGRPHLLIADLHTGFFSDPKWAWLCKSTLWLLRRSRVIVTNEEVLRDRARGVASAIVLHDVLVSKSAVPQSSSVDVLCPLSYSNDEPMSEVLAAARATPDLQWVFTGRPPESVVRQAPTNIFFTGYLSAAKFDDVLAEARVILAVTDRPHTMQRAGYESLMLRKPLVISDHGVLRDFHGDAAVYVDNSWMGIVEGVRDALNRAGSLKTLATDVLNHQQGAQAENLHALQSVILRGPS